MSERILPKSGSSTAPAKQPVESVRLQPPADDAGTATAAIRKLADPFPPSHVRWLPKAKQPTDRGMMPAVPFVDIGSVKDRLDDVLGVDGWEPIYQVIEAGVFVCTLKCQLGDRWVSKSGVGAATKENAGASFKSAESDSLKRAAAAFGVGRYLASLPRVYLPWDSTRKQFTEFPELPAWALPGQSGRPPEQNPDAKKSTALKDELVRQFDASTSMSAYGVIRFAAAYAAGLGKLTQKDMNLVLAADEKALTRLKPAGGNK